MPRQSNHRYDNTGALRGRGPQPQARTQALQQQPRREAHRQARTSDQGSAPEALGRDTSQCHHIQALPEGLPLENEQAFINNARAGDLLCFHGTGFPSSRLIEFTGPCSHVGFLIPKEGATNGELILAESVTGVGVRFTELSDIYHSYDGDEGYRGRVVVWRHETPLRDDQVDRLQESALRQSNVPYDENQILRIASRWLWWDFTGQDQKPVLQPDCEEREDEAWYCQKVICSDYVKVCFREAGVDLPAAYEDDCLGAATPSSVVAGDNFTVLSELGVPHRMNHTLSETSEAECAADYGWLMFRAQEFGVHADPAQLEELDNRCLGVIPRPPSPPQPDPNTLPAAVVGSSLAAFAAEAAPYAALFILAGVLGAVWYRRRVDAASRERPAPSSSSELTDVSAGGTRANPSTPLLGAQRL